MEMRLPQSVMAARVTGSGLPRNVKASAALDYRIYPLRAMRFEVPDYVVYDGIPSTTPLALCRVRTATTCNGKLISDKSPEEISLNSTRRWLASAGLSSTTWAPLGASVGESYYWSTSADYVPEQIVRTWSERVSGYYRTMTRTALSFPVGESRHFWSTFPVDYISEFTMTIVVDPYETSGTYTILDTGTATPLEASLSGDQSLNGFSESSENRTYFRAVGAKTGTTIELQAAGAAVLRTATMDIGSQWPVVVAIVGRKDSFDFYTWGHNGATPSRASGSVNPVKTVTRTSSPYSARFLLGRPNGTISNSANMALFEIAWWETALSDNDVIAAMSKLRAAYQIVSA